MLGAVLLLGGGAATAVALKVQHDNDAEAERARVERIAQDRREVAARKAEQQRAAEELQREEEELQASLDEIELDGRADLERGLRRSIVKDAKELVTQGLLTGPIMRAECDPVGGGRDDLEAHTGKYDCMAVHEVNDDGSYRGYPYGATINYDKFSYSWQLSN